jgi:hypothetical protein
MKKANFGQEENGQEAEKNIDHGQLRRISFALRTRLVVQTF